MTFKTKQEVLRAAADWMDVCEKAGIEAKCKIAGCIWAMRDCDFNGLKYSYEFPLGILDVKEVWADSVVYWEDGVKREAKFCIFGKPCFTNLHNLALDGFSWEPPKPKTITIELSVAMAEYYSKLVNQDTSVMAFACRKALENLK